MSCWNVQNVNETQKRRQLFAGRYSSLKPDRRSKSAFFACNYAVCGLLWVYLYLCLYEPINTQQVCLFVARIELLQKCARHPAEVRQSVIYEQIVKLCQNQGQILRKLNFCFPCENCIPRPVSKNLHYILKICHKSEQKLDYKNFAL